ncbi:hypothetical protein MTQ13_00685 [Streptomyces sp. XM4011]|uniref:hypothetical protein n=1 Tax=Streptomyces sp. XM4011 TaxID=2929780 RepID=UPI001FFBDA07|nr:hypothetical protein [Streptomyces sp. XM4011]MCK1812808.1 hypothetical protein [Streptomyces sp. XM4011]
MTRRRTRTALIAASAATALLLTACGGSDSGGGSDDIPGVDETTDEPAAPEDDADEEPVDEGREGRPEIDLGSDYENIYEDEFTGDPVVDEILLDNQGFNDAVDEAIITFDNERPALRYYIADQALYDTLNLLDNIYESGNTSGGASRYFNRSVTLREEGVATIGFCRDFSQVYDVDFETGEITKDADTDAKPSRYVARMQKNDDGVWQTMEYELFREDAECQ